MDKGNGNENSNVMVGAYVDFETDASIRIAAGRRRLSKAEWFREAIAEKLQREMQAALEQVPASL